jgi:hypothetical protein
MRAQLVFVALLVAAVSASFADEEFDLVMLAEREAAGAIPAHLRLNPETYASAEAARKAAEDELRKLGEEIDATADVKAVAEKEALNLAKEAVSDPWHSDMNGIKVDLGHDGAYAEPEMPKTDGNVRFEEEVPAVAAPAPLPIVDTQNEQIAKQKSAADVPVVKHTKMSQIEKDATKAMKPVKDRLPDAAEHLIEEEHGTRPGAPQFGSPQLNLPIGGSMQMPGFGMQMPNFGQFGMPQAPPAIKLQAPDLECAGEQCQKAAKCQGADCQKTAAKMPKAPTMMMGQMPMGMPQMQMPQMPQMQMPQMGQQMPQMGQQMPQMPQYQNLFPPGVVNQGAVPQMPQVPQQMPSFMQQMPLGSNQFPQMMQQMTQMLQGQQAPQLGANMQNMPQQPFGSVPDPQQTLQSMPQLLPQMMNFVPQLMGQMGQSMLGQMPNVMQQFPTTMQQMPTIQAPGATDFLQTEKAAQLEEDADEAEKEAAPAKPAATHAAHLAPHKAHKVAKHPAKHHGADQEVHIGNIHGGAPRQQMKH